MADVAELDREVADAAGCDEEWADLVDAVPAADLLAALRRTVRRIDNDLTRKKAEYDDALSVQLGREEYSLLKRDHARWRASAIFFKNLILARIELTKAVVAESNRQDQGSEFAMRWREITGRFARAVDDHRRASLDAEIKPEPHDVALWAVLDEALLEHGMPSLAARLGLVTVDTRGRT
jgi:hypothetical protein